MWSEIKIGNLTLSNRFVHTAIGEGFAAKDGSATPRLRDRYALLGRGGAIGMIITGNVYVTPEGQSRVGQAGLWKDSQIKGFAKVAQAGKQDGSRIFMQLNHGGIMTSHELTGTPAKGPSHLNLDGIEKDNLAMTEEEIAQLPILFAAAARRAREAGFDGVELHMAHGFGLSQWLSPVYNKRSDQYGGSIENRARLPLEIVKAVRAAVGNDFPILAKINGSEEGLNGGIKTDEAVQTARLLADASLDGIEVSGGSCILSSPEHHPMRAVKAGSDPYYLNEAKAFHSALDIPVILVGGVRKFEQAQALRDADAVDLVGIGRPLISEPDLILRWREGKRDTARCVSCSRCVGVSRTSTGVHCVIPL